MMIHDEVKIKVCRPGGGLFEVSGEHLQVITKLTHYEKVTMFIDRRRRMLRKWDMNCELKHVDGNNSWAGM